MDVMIFQLTLTQQTAFETAFPKTFISHCYTYKYIFKLHKSQEKMLDKNGCRQQTLIERVNEILKIY